MKPDVTLDSLTNALKAFCETNKLEFKSASDLRHEPSLSEKQIAFLEAYIVLWDAAEEVGDERGTAAYAILACDD